MGMKENTNELSEVCTAHGNVLRGVLEVSGEKFRIETDTARTWLNITDDAGSVEACGIDADGDVLTKSGEYVTSSWLPSDWKTLTQLIAAQ